MSFLSKLFGVPEAKPKLNTALFQTKHSFLDRLKSIFSTNTKLDPDTLSQLEEALYHTDMNTDTIFKLLAAVEKSQLPKNTMEDVLAILKNEVFSFFAQHSYYQEITQQEQQKPFVILVVGVNGVGKTTSIAKLAWRFKQQNKSVLLGAADTFRAAAATQLFEWSKKVNVDIVKKEEGADPSSVAFDTMKSALAKGVEVVLIDTAGRLHNKTHLMDELNKISRVIKKQLPDAPHEVLLVLDGTTGQNALHQAKEFLKHSAVTGLIITKLDGTAKGGFMISVLDQLNIPIKFIGIGEGMDDLIIFHPNNFVETFFSHL